MVLTVFGGLVLEMLPVQPDAAALRLTAPGSCTSSKRTERRWLTSQLLFPARRQMARKAHGPQGTPQGTLSTDTGLMRAHVGPDW